MPRPARMIGETFSHYRLLEKIGGGGMGVVYKAEDTRLGRQVALKFLPDELARDGQAVERFKREARAASALNHPHICTIHDVGEDQGRPFIAMELLEGQTLKSRLAGRPLPDRGARRARDARRRRARGRAPQGHRPPRHQAREHLRHRPRAGQDPRLRPRQAAREPARRATRRSTRRCRPTSSRRAPGSTLGTVAYMSPEQARGEDIDARTDLFSFGVVLYEMATGQAAFAGGTTASVFERDPQPRPAAALRAQSRPSRRRRPDRLASCSRRTAALRYQSATELHADLKRLKREIDSGRVAPAPARATSRWPSSTSRT